MDSFSKITLTIALENTMVLLSSVFPKTTLYAWKCYIWSMTAHNFGAHITYESARGQFTWPSTQAHIQQFVARCPTCQEMKPSNTSRARLQLPQMRFYPHPFHTVVLDAVEGLPITCDQHNAVLTLVERLTKFAIYIPIHKSWSAMKQAQALLYIVVFITKLKHHIIRSLKGQLSDNIAHYCKRFEQGIIVQNSGSISFKRLRMHLMIVSIQSCNAAHLRCSMDVLHDYRGTYNRLLLRDLDAGIPLGDQAGTTASNGPTGTALSMGGTNPTSDT
eukprot:scaffold763_cov403-Pavlova_lutheri.AAC.4